MRGLLLVFSLNRPVAGAASDPWFGVDKVQHFFVSAFVQSLTYGTLRAAGATHSSALAGATVTTAAVGVGKEIWDLRGHGDPSLKDLAWDAAGAGAMTFVLVRSAR